MLANWREINRLFCVVIWLAAVVLAVLIVGHIVGTSPSCTSNRTARGAQACAQAPSPAAVRVLR